MDDPPYFWVRAPGEASFLLSQMLWNARLKDRVAEFNSRIEALPKPPGGNRELARQFKEQGLAAANSRDFKQAAAAFKNAVQADPSDANASFYVARALFESLQAPEAEPFAGRLLSLSPGHFEDWILLSGIYAVTGRDEEAVAALVLAFEFCPTGRITRRRW
jgi:cytochrome c-type biogenesis protein CcmH/NrfG